MATAPSLPSKRRKLVVSGLEDDFIQAGSDIMNRDPEGRTETKTFQCRWMALFGVMPKTCVEVWNMLQISSTDPDFNGVKHCHLLWPFLLLKLYGSEEEAMTLCGGVDEKTFSKWAWLFVERISYLSADVILWENRLNFDKSYDCLVSVDGTDCMVSKIGDAEFRSFKTHKFKQPGLRYEVALCILTDDIIWVMGPFPCGDWPDINVFRYAIKQMLAPYERVEADDGYIGEDPVKAKVPKSMVHDQQPLFLKMRTYVRRQHETVNKRLKQFKVLNTVFRHDIVYHGMCFGAVAVLTQLEISNGSKLFEVVYSDDYFDLILVY